MRYSIYILVCMMIFGCKSKSLLIGNFNLKKINKDLQSNNDFILANAEKYLTIAPMPITQFKCDRSAGGLNDYYSEGDYWWPDTQNPDGPYIRKDGYTNPNNFLSHRVAMRNLNKWVSTLVEAYVITKNRKYADHALKHLNAFFLNEKTKMNPNLLYGQAIKGLYTGRGIGIIDTIHLIEIIKSLMVLSEEKMLISNDIQAYKKWFENYSEWMTTHQYGIDEKKNGNNHSTWWAAQLAAFASFTGNEKHMAEARQSFKEMLTEQMDNDGGFPDELSRTKPFNYSLFNLEGFATLCYFGSDKNNDLWNYDGGKGSLKKAFEFMAPYIKDKSLWKYKKDIEHFDELPVKTTGLFIAALAYSDNDIYTLWKNADPIKKSDEIERNFPYWTYKLWINKIT